MFPMIGKWFSSTRKELRTLTAANMKQHKELINDMRETLDPQVCRGFVDAFLTRQQQQEVRILHKLLHVCIARGSCTGVK